MIKKFERFREASSNGEFQQGVDIGTSILEEFHANTQGLDKDIIKSMLSSFEVELDLVRQMCKGAKFLKKKTKTKPPNSTRSRTKTSSFTLPSLHIPESQLHPQFESEDIFQDFRQNTIDKLQNITFSDIIGADAAKEAFKEAMLYPSILPQGMETYITPWKGLLVFGPPGTGKTIVAKAMCCEHQLPLISVTASLLCSKFRGESEKLVKNLFKYAGSRSPCVLFFDELDSCFDQRGKSNEHEASKRMKSELLIQMDGVSSCEPGCFIVGATNFPWHLDEALVRRFEKRVYIPLPDVNNRRQMFVKMMSKEALLSKMVLTEVEYKTLAEKTEGYSGADVSVICKNVAMKRFKTALHELEAEFKLLNRKQTGLNEFFKENLKSRLDIESYGVDLFLSAIDETRPSTNLDEVSRYISWYNTFGAG